MSASTLFYKFPFALLVRFRTFCTEPSPATMSYEIKLSFLLLRLAPVCSQIFFVSCHRLSLLRPNFSWAILSTHIRRFIWCRCRTCAGRVVFLVHTSRKHILKIIAKMYVDRKITCGRADDGNWQHNKIDAQPKRIIYHVFLFNWWLFVFRAHGTYDNNYN